VLFRDAASAFIRHCQSIRKLSPHTTRAYELDLAGFDARYMNVGHSGWKAVGAPLEMQK